MSLAIRAALAVILMVLFYALAVAAIAGLGWIGIHLVGTLQHIQGRGVILIVGAGLACLGAAGVIAWSVLPRWDRFEAPGPEVTEAEHPALFAELRRVAAATGQRMPVHVYVVFEVNAFVTQRGGIMGLGSRRVMGLGLPLLRTLQVDELRAVIAHEMGHFYGGDTKLGPWIYKTRGALARTVVNLQRAHRATADESWVALLFAAVQAPFRWFLTGFMRTSQAISRAQEYSADAVAVRAEGRRALVDGLKKTHAAAIAHPLYLRNEVIPMIRMGVLPPVGAGFSNLLASDRVAKLLDGAVEGELAEGKADPYDSHPPLRDRIAAAAEVAGPEPAPDPRRAIELVTDADAIETRHVRSQAGRALTEIAWTETGTLWTKAWRNEVKEGAAALAGITPATVPTDPRTIYELASKVIGSDAANRAEDHQLRGWWISVVGSALGLLLVGDGFAVISAPGEPFRLTRGDVAIEPFVELGALFDGELARAEWIERWTARGHGERELGSA
jgi:heat shock protein HtpX